MDPIDGTTNFASGLTLSAVSIGVAFQGEVSVGVIYDPSNEMFTAMAGRGAFCNGEAIRCNGAASVAVVVEGELRGGGERCGGGGAAALGDAGVRRRRR